MGRMKKSFFVAITAIILLTTVFGLCACDGTIRNAKSISVRGYNSEEWQTLNGKFSIASMHYLASMRAYAKSGYKPDKIKHFSTDFVAQLETNGYTTLLAKDEEFDKFIYAKKQINNSELWFMVYVGQKHIVLSNMTIKLLRYAYGNADESKIIYFPYHLLSNQNNDILDDMAITDGSTFRINCNIVDVVNFYKACGLEVIGENNSFSVTSSYSNNKVTWRIESNAGLETQNIVFRCN